MLHLEGHRGTRYHPLCLQLYLRVQFLCSSLIPSDTRITIENDDNLLPVSFHCEGDWNTTLFANVIEEEWLHKMHNPELLLKIVKMREDIAELHRIYKNSYGGEIVLSH